MASLMENIKSKVQEGIREYNNRQDYIKEMSRGFDVLPLKHKVLCGPQMVIRRLIPLVFSLLVIPALYLVIYNEDISDMLEGLKIVVIPCLVMLLYFPVRNIILFLRFLTGFYDVFGGYVLEKSHEYVNDPRYIDSHGELRPEFRGEGRRDLPSGHRSGINAGKDKRCYANINGVICRISNSQHTFLKIDGYYYVIRIKHRYISKDEFFFIKANEKLEFERTGNHFPKDENRKEHSTGFGRLGALALILGIFSGTIGGAGKLVLILGEGMDVGEKLPKLTFAALAFAGVSLFIAFISYIKRN